PRIRILVRRAARSLGMGSLCLRWPWGCLGKTIYNPDFPLKVNGGHAHPPLESNADGSGPKPKPFPSSTLTAPRIGST
ncbi:MAG: hypothetical protein VX839_11615, partial [Verrucomicrobiota bacterium]|nr:hypothetical protein [Verrucomicrobiota bacterium]